MSVVMLRLGVAMLSVKCCKLVVPGMATMLSAWASTQYKASWAGVQPACLAKAAKAFNKVKLC